MLKCASVSYWTFVPVVAPVTFQSKDIDLPAIILAKWRSIPLDQVERRDRHRNQSAKIISGVRSRPKIIDSGRSDKWGGNTVRKRTRIPPEPSGRLHARSGDTYLECWIVGVLHICQERPIPSAIVHKPIETDRITGGILVGLCRHPFDIRQRERGRGDPPSGGLTMICANVL